MENELKEYFDAVNENIACSRNELTAKEAKRKSYYRLIRAKEELRAKEFELLEPCYTPAI